MIETDLLILGSGTAATNAGRTALDRGCKNVVLVHEPTLLNTCIEEGCMPSKSILSGAHQKEPLDQIMHTKNVHIERLRHSLEESIAAEEFTILQGTASFCNDHEVLVTSNEDTRIIRAKNIIIATGSTPFIPPIPGLDTLGDKLLSSDQVVGHRQDITNIPDRLLTIGAGPIGLELSTFFHDMGSEVTVLNRTDRILPTMDEEFGTERLRAALSPHSFPINLNANLLRAESHEEGIVCTIDHNGNQVTERYDRILIATGRRPNLDRLAIENTSLQRDDRGNLIHDHTLQSSLPHIFLAGDVTGHHQILHYAAKMGSHAATNICTGTHTAFPYDDHMLAVSFDQFPSGLIGQTETGARSRKRAVTVATRYFKDIGLGILKRQEYGLWKIVADAATGEVLGSQILGPSSAGELLQVFVPILANRNTAREVANMTWYHPTYAEIIQSLARDITKQQSVQSPSD